MGKVSWTPEYELITQEICYLSLSLGKRKGQKISSRLLICLSNRLNLFVEHHSDEDISKLLNDAHRQRKEYKKVHKLKREMFLEDLAEALENTGRGKKATHLLQLIRTEEQREMNMRLKRAVKKKSSLANTFVTVPNDNGGRKEVTEKVDMEREIINENRRKFHQTELSCPFLVPPLVQHFGAYGNGPKVNEVLEGTYVIPEGIDSYTRDFLKACRMEQEDHNTDMKRSPAVFKST